MTTLLHGGMMLLVGLFAIGWAGSLVVVTISGIEDLKTVFSKDDTPHKPIEE